MKLDPDKSPLILSFSAQARLGVLASCAAAPASGCGLGEGTLEQPPGVVQASLSPAIATPGCKLAKASVLGEGRGEGVFYRLSSQFHTGRHGGPP